MKLCCLLVVSDIYKDRSTFTFKGKAVQEEFFLDYLVLQMILWNVGHHHLTKRHHAPEDSNSHQHLCENLTSHLVCVSYELVACDDICRCDVVVCVIYCSFNNFSFWPYKEILDSLRIEFRWKVRFSTPVWTGLWGQPSLLYDGYHFSFLRVQQPGYDTDLSFLALSLKEKLSYTSTAHLGLQRPVLVWNVLYTSKSQYMCFWN